MYLRIFAGDMGIEQDIRQSRFKSPYHKATVNLIYTASCLNHRFQRTLKEYDITTPQFNILRILRGQSPNATTVNDLIARMLDKSSNASRIVEKLVAKKLVDRRICPHDRRAVDVSITAEGLILLEKIDTIEPQLFFGLDSLSEEEASRLSDLLDKGRTSLTPQ